MSTRKKKAPTHATRIAGLETKLDAIIKHLAHEEEQGGLRRQRAYSRLSSMGQSLAHYESRLYGVEVKIRRLQDRQEMWAEIRSRLYWLLLFGALVGVGLVIGRLAC